jgi:ribokinase
MGENGLWFQNGTGGKHFPVPRVEAVDATGAGDTFNGALAVALCENRPIEEAITFANTAASLSVTRPGAQTSIPLREEVDAVMSAHADIH